MTEIRACQLGDSDEFFLEKIVLQLGVCHHGADAVFREARWFDAHLPQEVEDRREHITVALEFYDDQFARLGIALGFVVVELDVEINGQAFGLTIVDEGDAVETVLHGRRDVVERAPGEALDEGSAACVDYFLAVMRRHGDAFFLGSTVVVFRFHLEESEVAVQVSADANLLTRCPGVVMLEEETVLGGVPVDGTIGGYALVLDLLHEIFTLRQLQKFYQLAFAGDELGVGAIHQFDAAHLIERDGSELRNPLANIFVYVGHQKGIFGCKYKYNFGYRALII